MTAHYGIMPDKSRQIFCMVGTVLIILACMAAGCSSSQTTAPAAPPATPGGGATVAIKNFAFEPSSLTVKTGTMVTWVNNDGVPHALASDAGSPAAFSSDSLSTGASYSFTFSQSGMYSYHCSIHPSMKGTVMVQ
jgi:plastocyanin